MAGKKNLVSIKFLKLDKMQISIKNTILISDGGFSRAIRLSLYLKENL